MNVLSADQVIDATFDTFASISNAASLNERETLHKEPWGDVSLIVQSLFIPIASGEDGILISKTRLKGMPLVGQVERGIAYTPISGLSAVLKDASAVSRLYCYHLNPPAEQRAGVFKAGGWLWHYALHADPERIRECLIEEPQYGAKSAFAGLATSALSIGDSAWCAEVRRDATYGFDVVVRLVELIRKDLRCLSNYVVA